VPVRDPIIDLSLVDFTNVISDVETIRKYNRQRFEMEQITAIVYEDPEKHICVGYKDLTPDEFWIRGHMPDMPLMPGVIMCETAAQISSYYVQKHNLMGAGILGFGGMEDIRFRDPVIPGDRLVLALQMIRLRPKRMCVCRFQGFVGDSLVVEGKIKGIPLPLDALKEYLAKRGQ